jgi:hypothetical protein
MRRSRSTSRARSHRSRESVDQVVGVHSVLSGTIALSPLLALVRRSIGCAAFAAAFAFSNSVFAQSQVFVREHTYRASDADSKISSRATALEQVKRLLLEEVATYVQSTSLRNTREVLGDGKNGSVESLQGIDVKTITAGIAETKVLEERWNGTEYWLKAEIRIDPDETRRRLAELVTAGKDSLSEIAATGRRADSALATTETLRAQLDRQAAEIAELRGSITELLRRVELCRAVTSRTKFERQLREY